MWTDKSDFDRRAKYFILLRMIPVATCSLILKKDQLDALNCLKAPVALSQNDLKVKVIKLQSDRGGDFTRKMFKHYLIDSGIQHELTAASAPEQNGFIERSNRTIVDDNSYTSYVTLSRFLTFRSLGPKLVLQQSMYGTGLSIPN